MPRKIREAFDDIIRDSRELCSAVLQDIFDIPRIVKDKFPKAPKLVRVHISEELLLDNSQKIDVDDLDNIVAYEPATNIFYTLVMVNDGPTHFYCWRNMQVATFFLFTGERFQTIGAAIRHVINDPDMNLEIYKLTAE